MVEFRSEESTHQLNRRSCLCESSSRAVKQLGALSSEYQPILPHNSMALRTSGLRRLVAFWGVESVADRADGSYE